jgi:hypothetical protein
LILNTGYIQAKHNYFLGLQPVSKPNSPTAFDAFDIDASNMSASEDLDFDELGTELEKEAVGEWCI